MEGSHTAVGGGCGGQASGGHPGGQAVHGGALRQGATRVSVASSSLIVIHADHAGRLEAGAPATGALSIGDDWHLSSLQGSRKSTASASTSPASDPSVSSGVSSAWHGGGADVRAADGAAGEHYTDVIGNKAGALVIVGVSGDAVDSKYGSASTVDPNPIE